MATIKFIKNSEKQSISVRVKKSKLLDQKATTNLNISLKNWDSKTGLPKQNLKGAEYTQALLVKQALQSIQTKIENQLNLVTSTVTNDWLKNIITPPPPPENIADLYLKDYITRYYITDSQKKLTTSTLIRINTITTLLNNFDSSLKLKDLDSSFKLNFNNWMSEKKYSLGYKSRILKYVKSFAIHAKDNFDYELHNTIKNIKVNFDETLFCTLNKAEQLQILNTNMPHPYLNNAKRWLLLSCLLGQRVSDLLNISHDNIQKIKGKRYISLIQQKTKHRINIPISPGINNLIVEGFPHKISDVKYNKYIKEVCKLTGLDTLIKGYKHNALTNRKELGIYHKHELISTHIGRRSFATNNFGIISTAILCKITGHTTEKSFLKYINKEDNDLDKLDALFN